MEAKHDASKAGAGEDTNPGWAGAAPPYGAYRGAYGTYAQEQLHSVGSGQIEGWSYATQGGSFETRYPSDEELHAEEPRPPAPSWEEVALEELGPRQ